MRSRAPLFALDPSWLFLGAGLSLVVAAALIPAFDDLSQARYHRDRAVAMERYRLERLASYTAFLGAIEDGNQTLMRSLASSQLNLTPTDTELVLLPARTATSGDDVFTDLDPAYAAPPEPVPVGSTLERWSLDPRTRLWLLASGALFTLIGVLPGVTTKPKA